MKAIARNPVGAKQTPVQPKKVSAWIGAGVIAIHKRTRNRYIIDAIGLDKTHDQKVVIYRSCAADGNTYVREHNEFATKFIADRQLSICLE